MIRSTLDKLYGDAVVLTHLPGQRRVPFLPERQVSELRDARLRSIVRYAAETVPYYRDIFGSERIDPRDIRSTDDLQRLPLVDKALVRGDPGRFVSRAPAGARAIPFVTSGTSGEPLPIYHDRHSLLTNIAFGEREREVLTRLLGGRRRYRELYLVRPRATVRKVLAFYERNTFIPVRPERLFLDVSRPIDEVVETVNRFRPDVIFSYGAYAELFFRTLASRAISIHLPRVLVYGADAMTDAGRRLLEVHFGVPVLSHYNAMECFKIGFFCEERRGFHLHQDLCHVEIVGSRGGGPADGGKGDVVISNLVNRGTVLLNYRLGDLARLSDLRCPCRRTSPLLTDLEGRSEDLITLRDGTMVHPRAVWDVFEQEAEILQYQVIQHDFGRFEVRVVTEGIDAYRRVSGSIRNRLQAVLGAAAAIEPAYYESLPTSESGKFKPVMSRCKDAGSR